MVSKKNNGRVSASGTHAKQRHMRDARGNLHDMSLQLPPGLKAERDKPLLSASKHRHFMIQVENKDKKEKKLEVLLTKDRSMPGMEFVPTGNPDLTAKCKDLSREEGVAIYIVSPAYDERTYHPDDLRVETNRIGYHFRESIVERAREQLGISKSQTLELIVPGAPEPIPATQTEINAQADIAIKELFPRIPNFDRRTIIDRAFNKRRIRTGDKPYIPCGLVSDTPLSRRVQLAVVSHIRHTYTRYDQLCGEHSWAIARKTVEKLCRETLVKWRGDEENGRDQADAFLYDLVIISDTESDDDDDGDDSEDEGESSDTSSPRRLSGDDMDAGPQPRQRTAPLSAQVDKLERQRRMIRKAAKRAVKRKSKKNQRGFKRYQAAQAEWEEAAERDRREANQQPRPLPTVAMDRSASHGSHPWHSTEAGPASPLQVRHVSPSNFRSLDAPLGNRDLEGERLTYGDATHGTLPQIYYRQQGARAERDHLVGELGLIVGSQAPSRHHAGTSVERVRHQDQDLRDHLVKSIESPELPSFPSFPSQPPRRSSWELRRDMEVRSAATMVTYDRGPAPAMPTGDRSLQHNPPRDDLLLLAPRSQANRVMVETGFYPQSTIPVTSQPHGQGRIFTAPAATIAHGLRSSGYRDDTRPVPDGSSHRSEYRVITINDDDAALRSRARPIMVEEAHTKARRVMVDLTRDSPGPPQRQPPVMRSATQFHHPDSEYLIGPGHRAWNEARQAEQSANDMSQGFVQIIRVSDRFPRRHEPQSAPVEPARYELHSSTPRYRDHHHGFDGAVRYEAHPQHAVQHGRVERVVARVGEPLHGYHYPPPPDAMRQPGAISMNAHRQERVVGLEYVSAAPDRGMHSFASPPMMDSNEGGHWSRPASVMPTFQYQNHRPAPGQHFTREDGVIVLN